MPFPYPLPSSAPIEIQQIEEDFGPAHSSMPPDRVLPRISSTACRQAMLPPRRRRRDADTTLT